MTATGWTWDEIDAQMNFPRFAALSEYWAEFPPVHVVLRLVYGKAKPKLPGDAESPDLNHADLGTISDMRSIPIVQVPRNG